MSQKSWKFERKSATNKTGSGIHQSKRRYLRRLAEEDDCDEEIEEFLIGNDPGDENDKQD